jgi:hypothetical protein
MEYPFDVVASRPPCSKIPQIPAFEMVGLVVALKGVLGGACSSYLYILYLQYIHAGVHGWICIIQLGPEFCNET